MSKSICVIGQGFVGGSLTTIFAEKGFTAIGYDISGKIASGGERPRKLTQPDLNGRCSNIAQVIRFCEQDEILKNFSGIYFVCLPTPMHEDGEADLSIVEGVLKELSEVPGNRIAVVKSTVPPGSTERWNKMFEGTGLRVVFNPEFLTEANALNDMRNQDRIILGGPRPHINKVKQLFESAFPEVPVIKTSSTTAEMVKYVTNIHLAVKVALANEFYQICEALDKSGMNIDYDKLVEYAKLDKRLGQTHWKVPGPMPASDTGEPAMGFAGSCFIKDLNALMVVSKQLGIDPLVMSGAWQKNLEVRPQRDWEKLLGRAVSKKK
jgi:UDPglucose 6-dehydrogenase